MLAYFVLIGKDPRPNEQNFDGFAENIQETIDSKFRCKWHCLPAYLSRTIQACTCDSQAARMSFASALESFRAAHKMALSDKIAAVNPLILQEMAAIIEPLGVIEMDDFDRSVKVICGDPSKVIMLIMKNERDNIIVRIKITKVRSEADHRNIEKYLESAKNKSLSKFNVGSFKNLIGLIGQCRLDISADWPLKNEVSRVEIEDACNKIIEARNAMTLS